MTVSSTRDLVRLKIGDTDTSDQLLYDDEIDALLLEQSDDVRLAAASAAATIAAKYARGFNFSTDGQSFSRSERFQHYMDLSKRLDPSGAALGAAGVDVSATTRVDGFSDDIDYQQVDQPSRTGHALIGWTDPDLPV